MHPPNADIHLPSLSLSLSSTSGRANKPMRGGLGRFAIRVPWLKEERQLILYLGLARYYYVVMPTELVIRKTSRACHGFRSDRRGKVLCTLLDF